MKVWIKSYQVVQEYACTVGTILYIDKLLLDKQYMVCIGWANFILGQPVVYPQTID